MIFTWIQQLLFSKKQQELSSKFEELPLEIVGLIGEFIPFDTAFDAFISNKLIRSMILKNGNHQLLGLMIEFNTSVMTVQYHWNYSDNAEYGKFEGIERIFKVNITIENIIRSQYNNLVENIKLCPYDYEQDGFYDDMEEED